MPLLRAWDGWRTLLRAGGLAASHRRLLPPNGGEEGWVYQRKRVKLLELMALRGIFRPNDFELRIKNLKYT